MKQLSLLILAALLGGAGPSSLSAQCKELSGVVQHGDTTYTFEWNGKELIVKQGDREVSRKEVAAPGGFGALTLPIEGEKGDPIATLHVWGGNLFTSWPTLVAQARASLDLSVEPPPEALAEHLGLDPAEALLVRSVEDDGAAAKAGLQRFDVILALDGERKVDQEKLRQVLSSKKPGEELRLTVLRRGEERELAVKLGTGRGLYDGSFLTRYSDALGNTANRFPYYTIRGGAADGLWPTNGWMRVGNELFDYVRPGYGSQTRTAQPGGDETDTLEQISKRLEAIERTLGALQQKAKAEAVR
jgi:hypothetical protein